MIVKQWTRYVYKIKKKKQNFIRYECVFVDNELYKYNSHVSKEHLSQHMSFCLVLTSTLCKSRLFKHQIIQTEKNVLVLKTHQCHLIATCCFSQIK